VSSIVHLLCATTRSSNHVLTLNPHSILYTLYSNLPATPSNPAANSPHKVVLPVTRTVAGTGPVVSALWAIKGTRPFVVRRTARCAVS
jgi:hypothetical protein